MIVQCQPELRLDFPVQNSPISGVIVRIFDGTLTSLQAQ
jgi:hypothetical protein